MTTRREIFQGAFAAVMAGCVSPPRKLSDDFVRKLNEACEKLAKGGAWKGAQIGLDPAYKGDQWVAVIGRVNADGSFEILESIGES